MNVRIALSIAAFVALLPACAGIYKAPPLAAAPTETAMRTADAALRPAQSKKGLASLKGSGMYSPADKASLLKMAQLRFDSKNYGEAIVHALKVLERDPDDVAAYRLVAVSALRLANRSMADLMQKDDQQGSVRGEADEFVKLFRATTNDAAAPRPDRSGGPKLSNPSKPSAPAQGKHCKPTDPFCDL